MNQQILSTATYPKGVHSFRYSLSSISFLFECPYAFCLRIAISTDQALNIHRSCQKQKMTAIKKTLKNPCLTSAPSYPLFEFPEKAEICGKIRVFPASLFLEQKLKLQGCNLKNRHKFYIFGNMPSDTRNQILSEPPFNIINGSSRTSIIIQNNNLLRIIIFHDL